MKIGIISDTHGLLRPEAIEALEGADRILHGGDVGTPEVLAQLEQLAPVIAVRGNVDRGNFGDTLPITATLTLAQLKLHLLHIRQDLALDPLEQAIRLVIFGHSHKPLLEEKGGVVYLNPGAAGKRRFTLPITLAILEIHDTSFTIEVLDLLEPGTVHFSASFPLVPEA